MATAMPKPPAPGAVALDRLSDRALFARAATDESAFAVLVHRYREPLRRHAARYVGDADAEDVVQQALINASLAIRREPDREIEPKPWLYKVTTNAAIDHRRAQSVRPLGDRPHEEIDVDAVSESPGADPHDVATGRETVRSMVSGIKRLAPNQRRAATARFLEGRSHDEIASELGVSKGAARELIHRARRNLREAIPALSPVPLFVKLRESLTALFAGSGSAGAAKLTAGAVAVVVAAGAGGVAIKKANDDGVSDPVRARPASAPVAAIPKVSPVAERPRLTAAAQAAANGRRGGEAGTAGGSGGASGGGSGAAAGAAGGSAPGAAPAAAPGATSTPESGATDPVQGLADDLGVGEVTDQLGVGDGIDVPEVPAVPEVPGVDAPDLPDVGQVLGGGN